MYVSFCSVRMLYDLLTLLVPLRFPNRIQHSHWLLISINQFNKFVTADKLHYKSSKRPRYLERVYIQYISLALRLWQRCEWHRCAAIWYDLYINPRSSLMIRQAESAFIVFGWDARTGWQVVADWSCPDRVTTSPNEDGCHSLHNNNYCEQFLLSGLVTQLQIQWWACDMLTPVSRWSVLRSV